MEFEFFLVLLLLNVVTLVNAELSNTDTVSLASQTTSLPQCVTYSLPPNFKENCTKKGGRVTEAHSLAICRDKKVCQCPYYTCALQKKNDGTEKPAVNVSSTNRIVPKSSVIMTPNINTKTAKRAAVKSTPNIRSQKGSTSAIRSVCATRSLPPNFKENCTKNGGVVSVTYSMGLCQAGSSETCRCSYTACSTAHTSKNPSSKKSGKNKVKNATMEATTSTPKPLQPTTAESLLTETCAKRWEQCGGKNFAGPNCCQTGLKCRKINKYYSFCMK